MVGYSSSTVKRVIRGSKKVDSIFDGIGSFYVLGLPLLFVVLPFVTLLEPLLRLALAVTLVLTAFVCATLALSLVHDATERGAFVGLVGRYYCYCCSMWRSGFRVEKR